MEWLLRFSNTYILFLLFPIVILLAIIRLKWYRYSTYRYSLVSNLQKNNFVSRHRHRIIFFILRFSLLLGLVFFIGRPLLVDPRSNIIVDGIDMMLVLDVSGSMQFSDSGDEGKTRVDIAKQEAIRFIEKREHDPMGLVIFGKDAVSRCPITADKKILKSIVNDLHIGVVDPDGTVLSLGILTAANRLKNSKSKSKIMIVLTDGEPSVQDERPEVATEVAKRMGIKIYTIGIGSDKEELIHHPFYGMIKKPRINKELLVKIAKSTGGKFFLAENQNDMRKIYNIIDQLEKTEYETDIFSNYKELFLPFAFFLFVFVFIDILLSSFIWFGI